MSPRRSRRQRAATLPRQHRLCRLGRRLRIVISAGPTREPLDPIRFLSNYSTGYMGRCLVEETLARGHQAMLVSGPTGLIPPRGARVIWVERAQDMRRALERELRRADALIMAAAVCDFRPARRASKKLPRRGRLRLELTSTPDIVGTLPRRPGQVFAGFALETEAGFARARAKLRAKRLDLIVGQQATRSPFGRRPVQAFIARAAGPVRRLGTVAKPKLARALLDEIEQLWYGGTQ